jgi:hypothetical protein
MKDTKKQDKLVYEKPELTEIDLLNEEDVAKGFNSEPPPG